MEMHTSLSAALLLAALSTGAWADIALNPDVTPDTVQQTICQPGYTKSIRPSPIYTNGVKLKLLRESGQQPEDAEKYELDHIVPLAIGGHPRSLDNLTLQPWPDAKRKDRIEVKLQCLVCIGQVPLALAQEEIYSDWQAAYGKYSLVKCHRDRHGAE